MWSKLSQEEKEKCLAGFLNAMINATIEAVSVDRQIPRHMLIGQPKLTEQDKAARVMKLTVSLPPKIHGVDWEVCRK